MITLDQHNDEMLSMKLVRFSKKTGISCPKCNSELEDADDTVLCSIPPQRNVKCSSSDCNFFGFRY
jgi:C4-type Zn-finger protein